MPDPVFSVADDGWVGALNGVEVGVHEGVVLADEAGGSLIVYRVIARQVPGPPSGSREIDMTRPGLVSGLNEVSCAKMCQVLLTGFHAAAWSPVPG